MKIWIDDTRPAPKGYIWVKSVNEAKRVILNFEDCKKNFFKNQNFSATDSYTCFIATIESIDIDHDAGDYVNDGGDYIKLLDWLEETGRNYPIHIHSMNPVGRINMEMIVRKNGWKLI